MATQIDVVTGRRIPQSQIPAIEARADMLPYYYNQRREQANQDRAYELQQDQMGLQRDQIEAQRKDAQKAARAARINMGMNAGLQLGRLDADDSPATPKPQVQAPTAPAGGAEVGPGPTAWDSTKSALTDANTWAGGAFGALAGPEFGDMAFKGMAGKKERRVAGGAATGAITNAITSGGDPYSAAIGAIVGGIGGFL